MTKFALLITGVVVGVVSTLSFSMVAPGESRNTAMPGESRNLESHQKPAPKQIVAEQAPAPSEGEEVRYELLLPYQLEARTKKCPLVYIPVGSVEYHGEHLALGNDTIKAHGLCCEAAKLSGGVVFPGIYLGVPPTRTYGRNYLREGNVLITQELLRPLLNTVLAQLEADGFRAAVILTGHTPLGSQIELVRDVGKEYSGKMLVYGTADNDWAKDIHFTSDHAAMWETSILMYLHPELVQMDRLPLDPDAELEGIDGRDPRDSATPELGKQAVQAIARDLAALGRRLVKQAGGTDSE